MKFVGFSLFLAMVAVIQEVQSYRSVSGVRMGLFSHHPHSRQVLPGDTGGNEAVRTKPMQMQQWALAGVGAIFGFALSSPIPLPTENAYSFVHVAHADSTGKMSTKLTARKRYLPRIVTGVESFNAVQDNLDSEAAKDFLLGTKEGGKPGSDGFIRAMNLYGASLRRGEAPDDISRNAGSIVTKIDVDLKNIRNSKKKEDVAIARADIQEYLDFVAPVSSPSKLDGLKLKKFE